MDKSKMVKNSNIMGNRRYKDTVKPLYNGPSIKRNPPYNEQFQ